MKTLRTRKAMMRALMMRKTARPRRMVVVVVVVGRRVSAELREDGRLPAFPLGSIGRGGEELVGRRAAEASESSRAREDLLRCGSVASRSSRSLSRLSSRTRKEERRRGNR